MEYVFVSTSLLQSWALTSEFSLQSQSSFSWPAK